VGSTENVISTEAGDCQALIGQIKANHKQIALQWITGHCPVANNEQDGVLAKKGTKITQTHTRENILPFYQTTFKTRVPKCIRT